MFAIRNKDGNFLKIEPEAYTDFSDNGWAQSSYGLLELHVSLPDNSSDVIFVSSREVCEES